MIGLDRIIRVLLHDMARGRQQLIESLPADRRVHRPEADDADRVPDERLRAIFDEDAQLYHRARPSYPLTCWACCERSGRLAGRSLGS